jgi:peptidoglycan/LPS O-acetylase OafA/YrhL
MQQNRIIPSLTGLRAIAAGVVFFYHWFFHYLEESPLLLSAPFRVGYVGVPIFFALSGFLITLRYYDDFIDKRTTYWAYMAKRIIRIFPLYLFVLTFFVAVFGRPTNMIPQTLSGWIVVYSLTQAFFPDLIFYGTLVGWTLTIELLFYLIAPWILRRIPRTMSMRNIIIFLVALSLSFIAFGYVISQLPASWLPHTIVGQDMNWLMHYSIFGHLPDFLIGVLCAFIYMRQNSSSQFHRHAAKLIWISIVGMYLSTVLLDYLNTPLGSFPDRSLAFLVALFSSGLILGTAFDAQGISRITRLLSARWVVYLGFFSYALYLIQLTEPVQWLYWLALGEYAGIENRIVRALLLYMVVAPITFLLYKLVEKPSHRWFGRMFNR